MPKPLILALFAALCTLALTCKKEPPVVPEPTLSLTAVDASCIEAWLKVTTTQVPATVRLLRDGQPVSVLGLRSADSLVIDEGLLPKRAYTYVLQKLAADSSVLETSAGVQVTTMDTTSHNFTWQIDTLGDGAGSVLYDVAIINDTLAYAVGEIYKRDSMGNWDPNAYNLVKWDGTTWHLMRVQFYTFCGQSGTGSYPAKSIFAFSATDIWIGMNGSQVVRWNGQTQSAPMCTPVSINKIWGESPSSVWIVGNNGGIAHYNSSSWRRLESGTGLRVQDVYGSVLAGMQQVVVVASNKFTNNGVAIVRFSGTQGGAIQTSGLPSTSLVGIWSPNGKKYYTCGDGIFVTNCLTLAWKMVPGLPTIYTEGIRGEGHNDMFVVGDFGLVLHWNGLHWHRYSEVPAFQGQYQALATTARSVIAVGWLNIGRAVVLRGVR